MRQRIGGGLLIGVDVDVEEDLTGYQNLASDISGWRVLFSRLNPLSDPVKAPSIVAILMRVLELPTVNRKQINRELAISTSDRRWNHTPSLILAPSKRSWKRVTKPPGNNWNPGLTNIDNPNTR